MRPHPDPVEAIGTQYFDSADLLRKHESKVVWEDDARFRRQVEVLAEIDPEIAEWLAAHEEILE